VNRAVVALALEVAFFAVAFGWRSWLQWRRTGATGFVRPRRGAPPAELAGSAGFVAALVLLVAAPAADLAGLARLPALDRPATAWIGVALAVAGTVLTVAAQVAMGTSWRIGVDPGERTALVTGGIFARVRNPIFTAMVLASVGLVLLVPNAVAVTALVVLVVALELQVRLVEEPYLGATHGAAYLDYAARAGRFVPSLGRLGAGTRSAT
jgi:protein-S-isoprenylcysteine O-methyltransferase Ste14